MRALAAAEHQQQEAADRLGRHIRHLAVGQHSVAHRRAGHLRPCFRAAVHPLGRRERQRHAIGEARQEPVGPPHHRVLLVDRGGDAERARGHDRRQSGIAAEADHRQGIDLAQQVARLQIAVEQTAEGLRHGHRRAAGEGGRRDEMDGARRKFALVLFHALIGRELDLVAAALELLRQGGGGKQMPARAARGEKDRARGHAARSLMRSDSA